MADELDAQCAICGEFEDEAGELAACRTCGLRACSDCRVEGKCSDCVETRPMPVQECENET